MDVHFFFFFPRIIFETDWMVTGNKNLFYSKSTYVSADTKELKLLILKTFFTKSNKDHDKELVIYKIIFNSKDQLFHFYFFQEFLIDFIHINQ